MGEPAGGGAPSKSDEPGEWAFHCHLLFYMLSGMMRRKPFKPSLWTTPQGWNGVLEQVWFPGVHSNVGGSYSPDGLANEALHWMVEKAEAHKLQFDINYLAHYLPCFNSVLNDSMTLLYKLMGPYTRRIGGHSADGEAIHQSAVDRKVLAECQYDPKNLRSGYTQTATRNTAATVAFACFEEWPSAKKETLATAATENHGCSLLP